MLFRPRVWPGFIFEVSDGDAQQTRILSRYRVRHAAHYNPRRFHRAKRIQLFFPR
jgi:hypothetical protein